MFGAILPATVARIAKKVSLALLAACLPVVAQSAQNTTHYRWSADNRLTEVQSGNTRVSYGYDALGRRISRTWQQGNHTRETQWVLDTARPYSEIVLERTRSNGGAWKERAYVHTPDGVGLQISESEEGQTRHIYTDAQGSTRLITDEAGNVLQTLDYDAFGNEQTSGPTRHRYTGESFDSATGLYHLRARDYDPSTGRFISMDEHPGSRTIPLTLNKYLYGNADPVNHIDPSGNFGLVGVSMGGNIQATLANLQANFGFDLISNALDGGQSSASSTGWAVLASLAPMSIAKLSKGAIRVTSRMGKGKVAYLSKRKPLIHEIETAEFIADRKMVGIYLVGGNSSAGADAFINGLRWELKRINGTPSSVKSNIDKAIKQMENLIQEPQ